MRLDALFRLAFASATAHALTLPHTANSPAHSSKGRWSEVRRLPPTACKSTVSGTISLPSPGYFSPFPHGTGPLSVAREYLALRGGSRRFTRNSLRATWEHQSEAQAAFVYRALTSCGPAFQLCSTSRCVGNSSSTPVHRDMGPTTPTPQRHRAVTQVWV